MGRNPKKNLDCRELYKHGREIHGQLYDTTLLFFCPFTNKLVTDVG